MKKMFLLMLFLAGFVVNSQAQAYKVGEVASDFRLKNIDGKMVSLADYDKAKGFVVIFTCNHCPYAVAYEDRIIALDKKYKKKGYPVIAINPNDPEIVPEDSFAKMKQRAKNKGFTFPYLFDEKQEVYKKYGATRTPHVFVLQKKSDQLRVEYIGTIDNNYKNPDRADKHYLDDAVKALLKGEKPNPNYTKAIGCSIKSK